jgi:hypothetical protein
MNLNFFKGNKNSKILLPEELVDELFLTLKSTPSPYIIIYVLLAKLHIDKAISEDELTEIGVDVAKFKDNINNTLNIKNLSALRDELTILKEVSTFYEEIDRLIVNYNININKKDEFTYFLVKYANDNSIINLKTAFLFLLESHPELIKPFELD